MGFMDVSIAGSDAASDFAYSVGSLIAKAMREELKEEHSMWNTSGATNVALFFDEILTPSNRLIFNEELRKVARETMKALQSWLKNKDRNPSLDKDYKRLIDSLKKFLKAGEL